MESQLHPILSFGLISYFETAYLFFSEQTDIEQVEQVFHVFDTVQVAVYVQVTILHTVRFAGSVVFHRSNFTRFFNRTGTVGDISTQALHIEQGRAAGFHIDSRPDRAGKAKGLAFAVHQFKATAGKQLTDLIHPGI